ncbi:uncharacterized protein JCM15063_005128 [Sporobolomyces koalae]|uniref:uncharacterized protein n=1 Tax=Sporobolomyces koalae TaxID=500713 RepID=UPI003178A120
MRKARPFHPPASRESYKDLLIFEERLKQNAERLQKQRRKYQGFLVSLVAVIAYLAYFVLLQPSIYSLVHYSNVACLLVAATTLVLFFATGMYSDKIAYAYRFVPQANRALRPFNIYLNTRFKSRLAFLNPFQSSTAAAGARSTTSSPSLSRTTSARSVSSSTSRQDLSLSRQTSASSLASQTSFRSANALRSASPSPASSPPSSPRLSSTSLPVPHADGPVTRAPPSSPPLSPARSAGVPIPPIPPAQNPRGELIFSSRVNPTFREGYERYRSEWERRRKENKELERRRRAGSAAWWKVWTWGRESPTTQSEKEQGGSEKDGAGGPRGRPSGVTRMDTSNSFDSSRLNSRTNSTERLEGWQQEPSLPGSVAEALLSTVSTPNTHSSAPSPRGASPARPLNDSSTSLAPIDTDDVSATTSTPPLYQPEATSNSTVTKNGTTLLTHSRIRAESFSELLELEASNEENQTRAADGEELIGPPGPPTLSRSSSRR